MIQKQDSDESFESAPNESSSCCFVEMITIFCRLKLCRERKKETEIQRERERSKSMWVRQQETGEVLLLSPELVVCKETRK